MRFTKWTGLARAIAVVLIALVAGAIFPACNCYMGSTTTRLVDDFWVSSDQAATLAERGALTAEQAAILLRQDEVAWRLMRGIRDGDAEAIEYLKRYKATPRPHVPNWAAPAAAVPAPQPPGAGATAPPAAGPAPGAEGR